MADTQRIEYTGQESCCVCGIELGAEELAEFGEERVCGNCKDIYIQCMREGVNPSSLSGICYRDGNRLIMDRAAALPSHVCCYCGKPVEGKVKVNVPNKSFSLGRSFMIELGVCRHHKKIQTFRTWIAIFPYVGLLLLNTAANWIPFLGLMGLACIVVLVVLPRLGVPTIRARRFENDKISISGLGEEYLCRFPGR